MFTSVPQKNIFHGQINLGPTGIFSSFPPMKLFLAFKMPARTATLQGNLGMDFLNLFGHRTLFERTDETSPRSLLSQAHSLETAFQSSPLSFLGAVSWMRKPAQGPGEKPLVGPGRSGFPELGVLEGSQHSACLPGTEGLPSWLHGVPGRSEGKCHQPQDN